MSQSDRPAVRIGCPSCESIVTASVPGGAGIRADGREEHRLRGRESTCQNCGHVLEVYYY